MSQSDNFENEVDSSPVRGRSGLRTAGSVGSAAVVAGGSALGIAAAWASPAQASTFTVTAATDDGTGMLDGTLSKAIAEANANAGADTITFDAGLTTITFTDDAGVVPIVESLTIDGPGADMLTIDFDDNCGLRADLSSASSLSISGLTLKDGLVPNDSDCTNRGDGQGGALAIYGTTTGTVTISDVTFLSNYALYYGGGLSCEGSLGGVTIEDSTFTDNTAEEEGGGGAYLDCGGDVVISGSVFTGNSSGSEGGGVTIGVGNDNTATIVDSTFTGNTVNGGDGGGAYFENGTGFVVNSTFSGNTVYYGNGGAIAGDTAFNIIQSTVTGNTATPFVYTSDDVTYIYQGQGGGVRGRPFTGGITVTMSTISGNTAEFGSEMFLYNGDRVEIVGSIVAGPVDGGSTPGTVGTASSGYSIMGDNASMQVSYSLIGPLPNDSADYSVALYDDGGNTFDVTDPGLDDLADNGGPTETMALLTGSPAIDAGPSPVPEFDGNDTDQRGTGFLRVYGSTADIGAFELQEEGEDPEGPSRRPRVELTVPEELPETGGPLAPLVAAGTALIGSGVASLTARRRRRKG